MAKKLNDGTVVPSSLSMERLAGARQLLTMDYSLKAGLVTDIFYPDDKSNLSKQFIEYNVMVTDINANGNLTTSIYRNCPVNNRFGMSNNNETYTLQADNADDAKIEAASVVFLLCISGQSSGGQAVIIGGLPHPDGPGYKKADGQFYDFNFNGINYNINKDGEWTLTFNSPIDAKKKKKNEKAAGTILKIDKEGRIKFSDNEGQFFEVDRVAKKSTWSDGVDSIVIDKGAKSITLTSSGEMTSKSEKKMSLTSADALDMSSKQDASLKSEANVNMESKANFQMKSGGNWQVQVTGNAMVKAGGNLMMEGGAQAQLKGTITMLGAGSVPVAAVGVSMVLGTGNLGIPVVSQILTGSSTVLVGT